MGRTDIYLHICLRQASLLENKTPENIFISDRVGSSKQCREQRNSGVLLTTPALRKEFTAKNALYVSQHEEEQRAREAPIMAVSGNHCEYGLSPSYRRFRLRLGQTRQKGTKQMLTKELMGWRRSW